MALEKMKVGDSILTKKSRKISLFIFGFYALIAFLKHNYPEVICESFIDAIQNFIYILIFYAVCIVIVTLWSYKALKIEFWGDMLLNFVYLVGSTLFCITILNKLSIM